MATSRRTCSPKLMRTHEERSAGELSFDQRCQAIATGRRAAQQLRLQIARWKLSEGEFCLLWALRGEPLLDQRALATTLAVSSAQVSSNVERLRQQGLIEGLRPSDDRRRQEWRLTCQGRQWFVQFFKDCADAVDRKGAA